MLSRTERLQGGVDKELRRRWQIHPMKIDTPAPCPVPRMDPLAREFLAQCHAEAHHRSVKAGAPARAVPPLRAGLSVACAGGGVLGLRGSRVAPCQGLRQGRPRATGWEYSGVDRICQRQRCPSTARDLPKGPLGKESDLRPIWREKWPGAASVPARGMFVT